MRKIRDYANEDECMYEGGHEWVVEDWIEEGVKFGTIKRCKMCGYYI